MQLMADLLARTWIVMRKATDDDQIKQKHLLFAMKKWLTEDGVVLDWYNSKSLLYTPKHWQSTSFMDNESHNRD